MAGHEYSEPAVWYKGTNDYWWIGVCNNCEEPVLVHGEAWTIYPTPQPPPPDLRIPEKVRKDLIEAKITFSVQAFRACAVMARRAIQSACIEKGATKSDLINQIEELTSRGIITKDIRNRATAVRWIGNDAAHPNSVQVTQEDAENILSLGEQFLHAIYVTPETANDLALRKDKRPKN
jgi:hypothetical protein